MDPFNWVEKAKEKGYITDGCTGAPDLNVRTCCEEHDFYYEDLSLSRREADEKLRLCMQERGQYALSWVYWAAVRLVGSSRYKRKQDESRQKLRAEIDPDYSPAS